MRRFDSNLAGTRPSSSVYNAACLEQVAVLCYYTRLDFFLFAFIDSSSLFIELYVFTLTQL